MFLGYTSPVTRTVNKLCAGKHETHRHMLGLISARKGAERERDGGRQRVLFA